MAGTPFPLSASQALVFFAEINDLRSVTLLRSDFPFLPAMLPSTDSSPAPIASCIMFRSEEHTSELQSLMRTSYAVFCLKKKNQNIKVTSQHISNIVTTTN